MRREVRRFLAGYRPGRYDASGGAVGATARGAIVAREAAVIAGLSLAEAVFHELDRRHFSPAVAEGRLSAGARCCPTRGPGTI